MAFYLIGMNTVTLNQRNITPINICWYLLFLNQNPSNVYMVNLKSGQLQSIKYKKKKKRKTHKEQNQIPWIINQTNNVMFFSIYF